MSTPTQIQQMEAVVSICSQRKLRALLRSYGYYVSREVTLEMVQTAIAEYGDAFRLDFAKILKSGVKRHNRMNYVDGAASTGTDWYSGACQLLGSLFTASQSWGLDFGGANKANADAQIAAAGAAGAAAEASILANKELTKQVIWSLGIIAAVIVVLVVVLRKKK